MRDKIYLALVHYPVYNKRKETVATSVTNFDIHDISRSCRTYDIKEYHLITPVDAQIELTKRIIGYWQDGESGGFNKDREEAFENTYITESVEKLIEIIEKKEGKKPLIITTSAKTFSNSISYMDLSEKIFNDNNIYLLLFGTGWGLTQEIMDMSDYILHPIRPDGKYNHLSVRSAVSIILDRLLGDN
ncbi:hypothetical protein EV215_1610 [Hypnocyclicus thermotrophus]|uniref:tRNA (guanine-N(1)-)-methyltransferase C-terminal domain-containing protein n=1 Tax=Hypnocyclicus thermotrophus TaxID=1627895 RepID=A0AA46I537_9FUSO|nr:RNA methyltransferase [Hypnocyclicus thermotrophus]TDT68543.1 hypothetical protein EV215_1610 [Hypnocyclicus thermotrophus]